MQRTKDRVCPQCRKPFTVYPPSKAQKHCSQRCGWDSYRNTPDKFWALVDKNGPNGCWLWNGYRDKWGYGDLYYQRKHIQAARSMTTQKMKAEPVMRSSEIRRKSHVSTIADASKKYVRSAELGKTFPITSASH